MLSRPLPQDADRFRARQPAPIGTIAGHRHKGIRDGDDPGKQWNIVTAEAVGVAGAVNALVMVTDGRKQLIGER